MLPPGVLPKMPKRHGSSQNICVHNYNALQRDLLDRYLEELYLWNARVNLTSVPQAEAWSKHIDESVALLEAVNFAQGASVADLGTGAGLPGIPIAVVRPDLAMTLVESDMRKAGFLDHVLGLLGLPCVVANMRVEELGRGLLRESFDVVLTRAAFPPGLVPEMALPLAKVGGMVVAVERDAEAAASEMLASCQECGGDVERAESGVVVIRKVSATPERYPRRRPKQ